MKFAYGVSDFKKLITEGFFYIDRTDRIPALENAGSQLLFLRPRRFGKSLLINMLSNYYDIAQAAQFDTLFGHLAIGKQPTEKHNQYLVMTWDFSTVLPMASSDELKTALFQYLNIKFEAFADVYKTILKTEITLEDNALASFHSLMNAVNASGYKLYLFIDEYDNFANAVMTAQVYENQRYADLVYGEGLLKSLFKNIKAVAAGQGLDRVFITGVSPVVMADISSGYNVAKNIYRLDDFNDLCGFTETETREVLQQTLTACQQRGTDIDFDTTMQTIKQFYNGYCFSSYPKSSVYNPTLVLYFLDHLHHTCRYPEQMLDDNLAMDRDRIQYISKLPNGIPLIERILDESQPVSVEQLHHRFGVEDMLKETQEEHQLASLLYYLGVLTQDGLNAFGEFVLKVPNLVVRGLYIEKLLHLLMPKLQQRDYRDAKRAFFSTGDLQPLCNVLTPRFNVFSNRDYKWGREMAVKTAFLMLLFDDRLYVIDSEPELKRRYADLTLIIRPDARKYPILDHLLEFKFLGLKTLSLSGAEVQALSDEALQQLPAVQAAFAEAASQLQAYQPVLEQRYGEALRLQLSAVVAIGFDRLLWQKINTITH